MFYFVFMQEGKGGDSLLLSCFFLCHTSPVFDQPSREGDLKGGVAEIEQGATLNRGLCCLRVYREMVFSGMIVCKKSIVQSVGPAGIAIGCSCAPLLCQV